MSKTKIAFVCQRYGVEVNGGSEQYCRQVAEKLSEKYDVTVYTTTAHDYITWANSYASGETKIKNVTVKRYPVKRTRKRWFSAGVARLLHHFPGHPEWAEWWWIDLQGPYAPDLLKALKKDSAKYQTIFFMTYLYYPAAKGLMLDFPNAVLIPTAHDEPPIRLRCYDEIFGKARGYVFLTPEEKQFVLQRFPQVGQKPGVMAGIGIDLPTLFDKNIDEKISGYIRGKYILYVGRIAESKGCDELFKYFRRYKKAHPGPLKLILLGKPVMKIPDDLDIISLGFVSDEEKYLLMKSAEALVLHSHYESLSMVVLESMAVGCPVVVTDKCDVLKGHCERSGAGLSFAGYEEYETALEQLLTDEITREKMSENGMRYVFENYRWDVVLQKYDQIMKRS